MRQPLMINGHTASHWSEVLGIPRTTIIDRHRRGYPPDKILSTRSFRTRSTIYVINDELITAVEAEKRYGIHRKVIRQRYNRGLRDLDLVVPPYSKRSKKD